MKISGRILPVPKNGFSLVELSIVMVVVGVLLAALIPIGTGQNNVRQYELTKHRLDIIQKALNTHIKLKGGLPCPASKTVLPDTANFGVATDCTAAPAAGTLEAGANPNYVRIGAVPVRTLNLPEAMMFDAWGRRFTYAVTRAATGTSLSGVISIIDANNNSVITPAGSAAYAVFSSGREGKGTHSRHGGATASCGTTTKDSENCDNDITFRDMAVNDGSDAANFFDDVIIWRTPPMIEDETGSLGTSGSGGGNASSLAANDDIEENWSNFRGVYATSQTIDAPYQATATPSCYGSQCPLFTFDPENTRRSCSTEPGFQYHCNEIQIPDDISLIAVTSSCHQLYYSSSGWHIPISYGTSANHKMMTWLVRLTNDRRLKIGGICSTYSSLQIRFVE